MVLKAEKVKRMWKGKNSQASSLYIEYRQLRNVQSGRNTLPQGRAQQLLIQYQIVTFYRLSRCVCVCEQLKEKRP